MFTNTCVHKYKANCSKPSLCIPSNGNILKNLSTEAKSSFFTASLNFSVITDLKYFFRCVNNLI